MNHWNVVFDVGRVLVDWDVYSLYRTMMTDDAEIEAFLDETGLMDWNLKFDGGMPFAEGVAVAIERHPHHAAALQAFDDRWEKTVTGAVEESVNILGRLKSSGVPLYAITNFSAEKWPLAVRRFPFLAESFIDVVVSGDEGIVKPDREIFMRLISRNKLRAQECIFVDDSPKNVDGANAVGMKAILFTSPAALEAELKELGLLQ